MNLLKSKLILLLPVFLFMGISNKLIAQQQVIEILKGENWYGAAVADSEKSPYKNGYFINMNGDIKSNQAAPFLVSSKGRYIWNDNAFAFRVDGNKIILSDYTTPFTFDSSGNTLKDGYTAGSNRFFPASGKMPDELLFLQPHYNTWIELGFNQNQKDVLKYAKGLLENGFPAGVLMIDDNWSHYFGNYEFRKDRFPDPKAMIDELHNLGFKVMLWISPFIRPDSEESRFLEARKWVVMNKEGSKNLSHEEATRGLVTHWWNGYSMVMDFSHPGAVQWFQDKLDNLIKDFGVDGFKLDGGDPQYYEGGVFYKDVSLNDQNTLFGQFGLRYPLNEYRTNWKMGGQPIYERLRDKHHTWTDLQKLIPHITTSSLLGYPFTCSDMIGGGDMASFVDRTTYDQELIVRSAQIHALMPMMQFSVAPWRILDKPYFDAVKKSVEIRSAYVPEIMALVKKAAKEGSPVVAKMEYVFPNQGFGECNDQFMLGDKILVAPMVEKGNQRNVVLPKGNWIDNKGKKIKGGKTISIQVALDELPIYKKV